MSTHGNDLRSAQKKQMSETVAIVDQMESKKFSGIPNSLDKFMMDKLVKGEKAGGIFSKVKIEPDQTESCVQRLGDLNPDSFITKKRGISQPTYRSINRKQQIKMENVRSFRLDAKLSTVVSLAKKKLAKSPEGKKVFRKIVKDLHLKGSTGDSSEDETRWDIDREMKKFRAGSKH